MAIRSELFTTQVVLENRTYFFNVKENRTGDIFLQIVESKPSENPSAYNRLQVAVFAEDMQQFLKGLDTSLSFIEKERKNRKKIAAEKRAAKDTKYAKGGDASGKKIYKRKGEKEEKLDDGIKRTGKVIHITSKRKDSSEQSATTDSEN